MSKRKHPEAKLQRAVAKYLDARGLLWCHVPNERSNEAERKRLSGLGVKPGVPDVLIFDTDSDWIGDDRVGGFGTILTGVAIELKAGTNQTTPAQQHWLDRLQGEGWRTAVCRTIDEVIAICDECYGVWGR